MHFLNFWDTLPHFNSTSAKPWYFLFKAFLGVFRMRENQSPSLQMQFALQAWLVGNWFHRQLQRCCIYSHPVESFYRIIIPLKVSDDQFTPRGKFLSDYTYSQGLRWPVHTMWKVLSDYTSNQVHTSRLVVNWFHRRLKKCFSGLGILNFRRRDISAVMGIQNI